MSLPNNPHNVNKKIFTFFQETENNRSQILTQKNEQFLVQTNINKSTPNTMTVNKIVDIGFDWMPFQTLVQNIHMFQTWELTVRGLKFEQLATIRHSYIMRYGSGDPLLPNSITDCADVKQVHYISSNDLDNKSENEYVLYYGFEMTSYGSEIVDSEDDILQVKLNISLINPNTYM